MEPVKPLPPINTELRIKLPIQKPEFATMSELLKDAEKYDTANQKEISLTMLNELSDFIFNYINK